MMKVSAWYLHVDNLVSTGQVASGLSAQEAVMLGSLGEKLGSMCSQPWALGAQLFLRHFLASFESGYELIKTQVT